MTNTAATDFQRDYRTCGLGTEAKRVGGSPASSLAMRLYHFFQTFVGVQGSGWLGTGYSPVYNDVLNEVSATVHTELNASGPIDLDGRANSGEEEEFDRSFSGFALPDGSGRAYNEKAFQYFLEIERKRSEISNGPFLLMLIDFKRQPGMSSRINMVTDKLFSVLSLCLRETDFIGWYREGRVVGAVLTQHGRPEADDLSEVVRRRISGALEKRFPSHLARHLEVRIYRLPANTRYSE